MVDLSLAKLNHFIDYSSFDESIDLEEFLSNKTDNQLSLAKLFAYLRIWNKTIQKNFSRLIFLVCENLKMNYRNDKMVLLLLLLLFRH